MGGGAALPGRPSERAAGPWSPLTPREAAEVLSEFRSPWWIAGGWAIDLFLGHPTRPHGDLDVEILRRDQRAFRRALGDWDLHSVSDGRLRPWSGRSPVPSGANSLWCRSDPAGPWRMQVLLAHGDGSRWQFRRDPSVRRDLADVGSVTPDGIPYLTPEIELLYKARSPRPKDDRDLDAVIPAMEASARQWLHDALARVHPGHAWLARLAAA
jgi:Aminoglycoside-2''-adenylyltransferase